MKEKEERIKEVVFYMGKSYIKGEKEIDIDEKIWTGKKENYLSLISFDKILL